VGKSGSRKVTYLLRMQDAKLKKRWKERERERARKRERKAKC
jgi:hypothetical protein